MEPVVRLATYIESQNVVYLCSLVQFHPDISRLQLFSSSQDCGIRLWDLSSSKCVCVLQSHYSAVTSLSFSPDGDTMVRYCTLIYYVYVFLCGVFYIFLLLNVIVCRSLFVVLAETRSVQCGT